MAWQTPVYDRVADDPTPSKKFLNASDVNRIEGNIEYLETECNNYFGGVTLTRSPVTSHTTATILFKTAFNGIENNLIDIKDVVGEPTTWHTPETSRDSGDVFDYEDANNIEENLYNLKLMIDNIKTSWRYCNTFWCGYTVQMPTTEEFV